MLLQSYLSQLVTEGRLLCTLPDGKTLSFGQEGTEPEVALRFHAKSIVRRLPLQPSLVFAEGYMDGSITLEKGSLKELLYLVAANAANAARPGGQANPFAEKRLLHLAGRLAPGNGLSRARRNVARHYDDIPDEIYALFLDEHRQYTCGYWAEGVEDLDASQRAKIRHLAAKLRLDRPGQHGQPGLKVLDIGSGWGALAVHLAREHGAVVDGITLSRNQLEYSQALAEKAGVAERCRFRICDYRKMTGRYDRIVSVGMFEHVGRKSYPAYFAKLAELLDKDGIALLHTIVSLEPRTKMSEPFMRRYIFPGGQIPALPEVMERLAEARLFATDCEIWRLHYTKTLEAWHERFTAAREEVLKIRDERFFRMWSLYLLGMAASFRYGTTAVAQVQMTQGRMESPVPATRDYLYQP